LSLLRDLVSSSRVKSFFLINIKYKVDRVCWQTRYEINDLPEVTRATQLPDSVSSSQMKESNINQETSRE
jgi:hypothetical protein